MNDKNENEQTNNQTSVARRKTFQEKFGYRSLTKPRTVESSIEFASPPSEAHEEKDGDDSLQKQGTARSLFEVSRGKVDTVVPSVPPPAREIDTNSARYALSQDLGGDKVHVLEDNPEPAMVSAEISTGDAQLFADLLDKGWTNEQKRVPVAENPIDAEIQKIETAIRGVAHSIKKRIDSGMLSEEDGKRLEDALEDLSARESELMDARGELPGDTFLEKIHGISKEITGVSQEEWEKRFIGEKKNNDMEGVGSDAPAPAKESNPKEDEGPTEETQGIKYISGAIFKTLEDLRLPIGRLLVPEKKQLEDEFHALGEKMVKIVNDGEKGVFSRDEITQLRQDVEILKQKVAEYAEKEIEPATETQGDSTTEQKTIHENKAVPTPETASDKKSLEPGPVQEKPEKELELKAEIEAISQFEELPPEQKLGFWKTVASIGYSFEQKKNEFFADAFGFLAGNETSNARDESLKRFFASTQEILTRDAKRSEQNLADLRAGKESKLNVFGKDIVDIKTLRGSGFLWGNIMKIGRSFLGPFAWLNTGLMTANIGLEAAKEARLANEDVIEKTRIQDMDQARDEAIRIYQEAKEKAGAGNAVSKETLEKAYQEGIPRDLLERLAKNVEPGMENSIWQKLLRWDMQGTIEKIETELAKIDSDESLSDQARNARKDAYLNNWYTRSQRLKDYDRIVSQNGEIDELASLARYGEFTAKTAVYAMMADSMRRVGMKLAELFSSSDGVEIIAGSASVAGNHNGTNNLASLQHETSPIVSKIPSPSSNSAVLETSSTPSVTQNIPHMENLPVAAAPVSSAPIAPNDFFQAPSEHLTPNTVVNEETFIPKDVWATNAKEIPIPQSLTENAVSRGISIENSLQELGKVHAVVKGDTIWSITKGQLGGNMYWQQLGTTPEGIRQQNFILDTMRHDLLNRSQSDLIKMGIKSGDINRIYPNDQIDLSKVFNKNELMRLFSRAEQLHPQPSTLTVTEVVSQVPAPALEIVAPTQVPADAFSILAKNIPVHYTETLSDVLHSSRPDISTAFYDTKIKDILATNPNGMKDLEKIFSMKDVAIPEKLTGTTADDTVKDYFARIAWQHDIQQGHADSGDIVKHLSVQETASASEILTPKTFEKVDIGGFKSSLETWGILPDFVKKYIVIIDGQIGKNIDHVTWENMRALSAKDVLRQGNVSIQNRLIFLQDKADVAHHPDMEAVSNETLEHYIARLTNKLWLMNPGKPPEIPKEI